MGPPFFFFLLNQACKGVALQNGGHFVPYFLPGPVHGAENDSFATSGLDEALIQGQGTLFGPDHVEQGNLARVFCQIEAASDPSLRSDNTFFDEWLKDFGEKGRCDVLGLADIFLEDDLAPRLLRQIEQGAYGILRSAGYKHF